MLAILTSILGSTGFGALLGALGGVANRFIDIKLKTMELEAQKVRNQHELDMRDKDLAQVQAEWDSREKIATIEGEAKSSEAAYGALAASYGADKTTYGIKAIDGVRGLIRPLITLLFTGYTMYLITVLNYYAPKSVITPALFADAVAWVFFETSVVVGWWFGARAGTSKNFGR